MGNNFSYETYKSIAQSIKSTCDTVELCEQSIISNVRDIVAIEMKKYPVDPDDKDSTTSDTTLMNYLLTDTIVKIYQISVAQAAQAAQVHYSHYSQISEEQFELAKKTLLVYVDTHKKSLF
jgi:hypothetical protein